MRTCLGIIGAFLAVVVVAALCTSWVVVYVHDRDEGLRVLVPAPMFLADIALRIGDAYADVPELPAEAREALVMLPSLVDELIQAPDFELLRIEQPDVDISIRKIADQFDIHVIDGAETVHVKVPVQALEGAARAAEDGDLRMSEFAGILNGVSRTELVNVSTPEEDVRVWVW